MGQPADYDFARISRDKRLTLVINRLNRQRTYCALSEFGDLSARENLQAREGTPPKQHALADSGGQQESGINPEISARFVAMAQGP